MCSIFFGYFMSDLFVGVGSNFFTYLGKPKLVRKFGFPAHIFL
jgi:hypothetical protein